ncbi:MAG: glycosyltransferase family 2 protein [Dysgonomonas mossii]|uniref:glycosyltransferase family 2 protein n=1 Tax=Dysgonomonas TaxID=156973 RepID=UPI00208EB631|nr:MULTISPECIES: glycosyltransferase family 2 protein [Dysgonomonas]
MELVSIIIATYNAETFLERAIRSVLDQTYPNIECIVIDGCSTDNTLNILEKYKSEKFCVLSEPDKGIYDALNKGWKLAKGDWIHVLGSDDELLPDAIKVLIEESTGFDVVYGNTIDRYPNETLRYWTAKDYTMIKYVMICCHQGMIMRRSAIESMGGFNTKYPLRADFDLTQKLYLQGYHFKQIKKDIAYFFIEGTSGMAPLHTDIERYKILKANKSTKFPFFAFSYFFIRKIVKRFLIFLRIKKK